MAIFVGAFGFKSFVQKLTMALSIPVDYRAFHPYRALQEAALKDTLSLIMAEMTEAIAFDTPRELLAYALGQAPAAGFIAEFGVNSGGSINFIAASLPGRLVHGFDSFEGLPENWSGNNFVRGEFGRAGRLPRVRRSVRLHKGWFDATLPAFAAAEAEPAAFLHIDCDLYSSTRTILDTLVERVQPGTIVVFDEYFNYPFWQSHEHRAWRECVEGAGLEVKAIGYSFRQVAFQVLARNAAAGHRKAGAPHLQAAE